MLFIISGPSGVGKGTIISQLLSMHPHRSLAVSATTRQPRGNEIEGKDYYFLSHDAFKTHISNDDFLEYCEVHQNFYGTLASEVTEKLRLSKAVIIEIDVQGAQKIKQHTQFKQHHIFIAPPSLKELAQRLQKRDTETAEIMDRRLEHAKKEINQQHLFDSIITNDALTQTVGMVDNIILNLTKESV